MINKRIPQIDGMDIDKAHKKGGGSSGPSAEEIEFDKQRTKREWNLEDASKRFDTAKSAYDTDYAAFQEKKRVSDELKGRGGLFDTVSNQAQVKRTAPAEGDFSNKVNPYDMSQGQYSGAEPRDTSADAFLGSIGNRLLEGHQQQSTLSSRSASGEKSKSVGDYEEERNKYRLGEWDKSIGALNKQREQWENQHLYKDKSATVEGQKDFAPKGGAVKKKGLLSPVEEDEMNPGAGLL